MIVDALSKDGIRKHKLHKVSEIGLQLHRIWLIARRMTARVPEVDAPLELFVLAVVEPAEKATEENEMGVRHFLNVRS